MNKHEPKVTDTAIITTKAVATSKDNQKCFLYAKIKTVLPPDKELGYAKYKIRTDLVKYQDETYIDLEGKEKTKKILKWVEQKEDWFIETLTIDEINTLINQLSIPNDLTRTEEDDYILQNVFLLKRKALKPWGVKDWEIV